MTHDPSIRGGFGEPTAGKGAEKGVFSATNPIASPQPNRVFSANTDQSLTGGFLDHQTIYGIYLSFIEEYLQSLGADSARIFREAGLEAPSGNTPARHVDANALVALMLAVQTHAPRSAFFLELGARIPIMAHGNLGAALMACKDVATVFTLIERYAAIALSFVRIRVERHKDEISVEYLTSSPWPEVNIAILEAFLGTTGYNLSLLTGQPLYPTRVDLNFKAPPHAALYQQYVRCPVRFDAGANRLMFKAHQFGLPIMTANAISQRHMEQQCEDELKRMQSSTRLVDRIRDLMTRHLEQSPSISFVAERLHTSERTLRRHLDEEGVNFRDLLREVRLRTACYYLGQTNMRIEHIALRLGYRETANFRKAFKDETGLSPRQWRDQSAQNTIS